MPRVSIMFQGINININTDLAHSKYLVNETVTRKVD